jgi:hypothetical protein
MMQHPRAAGRYRPGIVEGGNAQMTDQTPVDPTPAEPPPPAAPPAAPDPAPTAAPPPSTTWTPPASAGAAAGARPTGITILAVLAGIGGIFGLLGGFGALFVGGVVASPAVAVLGLAALAYAALLISFAYGAWTLKPWAWSLGVAVAGFGIVVAILQVVLGGSSIYSQVISILIDAGILYYLNQPGIKALFGRA